MNSFTLDDIEYLVISGKRRLDETGEYNLDYYENFINENVQIIAELIRRVYTDIKRLQDPKKKEGIVRWTKDLLTAHRINKNANVRMDYENSSYSKDNLTAGYFQNHPYAKFIEDDYAKKVKSFSFVVRFMNNIYQRYTLSERKGEYDSNILWSIFESTKQACALLGIHCPPAQALYDSITGDDPYAEKDILLEMDVEIDETNTLSADVLITSLPYTVTAPTFTWEGPSRYEMNVTDPKPTIYYKQSYFQKPHRGQ